MFPALWRRGRAALPVLLAGLLILFGTIAAEGVGAPAREGTSAIAGRVTREDGTGLVGVAVLAMAPTGTDGTGWRTVTAVATSLDGRYVLGGLEVGTYRLFVNPIPISQTLAQTWWSTSSATGVASGGEASDVVITAPNTQRDGCDVKVLEGGILAGHVTDAAGVSLGGAVVRALRRTVTSQWQWVQEETSDASGNYRLTNLAPGSYRVWFQQGANSEYWDNQLSVDLAKDVVVGSGLTAAGIDAALGQGAMPTSSPSPSAVPSAAPTTKPILLVLIDTPKIRGQARVGTQLRITPGAWSLPGTRRYQWYAGRTPIAKATQASYRLTRRERGKRVRVRETARYQAQVKTSWTDWTSRVR